MTIPLRSLIGYLLVFFSPILIGLAIVAAFYIVSTILSVILGTFFGGLLTVFWLFIMFTVCLSLVLTDVIEDDGKKLGVFWRFIVHGHS